MTLLVEEKIIKEGAKSLADNSAHKEVLEDNIDAFLYFERHDAYRDAIIEGKIETPENKVVQHRNKNGTYLRELTDIDYKKFNRPRPEFKDSLINK